MGELGKLIDNNSLGGVIEKGTDFVEKAGDAIDKNLSTKDELQKNEIAFSKTTQEEATKRYAITAKSDFLPSKLVRPFVVYSCVSVMLFLIVKSSFILFDFKANMTGELSHYERARLDFVWTLLKELLFVFGLVIGPAITFYFVDRLIQHTQKIKRGFFEPENDGLFQKAKRSIGGWFSK